MIGTDLRHIEENSIILNENFTSLHGKKKQVLAMPFTNNALKTEPQEPCLLVQCYFARNCETLCTFL